MDSCSGSIFGNEGLFGATSGVPSPCVTVRQKIYEACSISRWNELTRCHWQLSILGFSAYRRGIGSASLTSDENSGHRRDSKGEELVVTT
jgi:hypothetical protein